MTSRGSHINLLVFLIVSICSQVFATTYIGQSIEKDSKWFKSQGPYIITIDLMIYKDACLEIEAGTQVFFSKETNMTVAGNLIAIGTKRQKISFSGLNNANWGGFVFTRDCNDYNPETLKGVCFKHCQFEGTGEQPSYLIKTKGCDILLDACQIKNCYTAIQSERQAEIWLTNSHVDNCNRVINVKNTSIATISNNKMNSCNSIILGGTTKFNNNILKKFTAHGRHSGLIVWMSGGGIVDINNNQFVRFESYAIKLQKKTKRSTFILKNNSFKNNNSNLKLSCLYFNKGKSTIEQNNFYNFKDYQVSLFAPCSDKGSETIQIGSNYWGKLDQENLRQATYDHQNDANIAAKIAYGPISKKLFKAKLQK